MVKNPNRQEADQHDRGVELGAPEKQLLLAVREGLEHGTSRFQVQHALTHSTTLPPQLPFITTYVVLDIIDPCSMQDMSYVHA